MKRIGIILAGIFFVLFVGIAQGWNPWEPPPPGWAGQALGSVQTGRLKSTGRPVTVDARDGWDVHLRGSADWISAFEIDGLWMDHLPPMKKGDPWIQPIGLPEGCYATEGLNIRAGPGTEYQKVGFLNQYSRVEVSSRCTERPRWVRTDRGFVHSDYLANIPVVTSRQCLPNPPEPQAVQQQMVTKDVREGICVVKRTIIRSSKKWSEDNKVRWIEDHEAFIPTGLEGDWYRVSEGWIHASTVQQCLVEAIHQVIPEPTEVPSTPVPVPPPPEPLTPIPAEVSPVPTDTTFPLLSAERNAIRVPEAIPQQPTPKLPTNFWPIVKEVCWVSFRVLLALVFSIVLAATAVVLRRWRLTAILGIVWVLSLLGVSLFEGWRLVAAWQLWYQELFGVVFYLWFPGLFVLQMVSKEEQVIMVTATSDDEAPKLQKPTAAKPVDVAPDYNPPAFTVRRVRR